MDTGIDLDSIKERYLSGELETFGNNSATPDWLHKEAGAEEDWETVAKRQLEINALGRDMVRQFPAEKLSGVYHEDRNTGTKKLLKSSEEVLAEMYSWLNKKAKGDLKQAVAILDSTQLIDEYRNPIIQMFKNANEEETLSLEEKAETEAKEGQPINALRAQRTSETTADQVINDQSIDRLEQNEKARSKRVDYAQPLERKKIVGSLGIIINEQTSQLWKKGELVAEMNTEAVGGFAVMADEMHAIETEDDAMALFAAAPVKEGADGFQINTVDGNWVMGTFNGMEFEAKIFTAPSEFGINNGYVSKLWIKSPSEDDSTVLVNYDRGWDIGEDKPETWQPLVVKLEQFVQSPAFANQWDPSNPEANV